MSYNQVFRSIEEHFDETDLEDLILTQRSFPSRVLADIHFALSDLEEFGFAVRHYFAAQQGHQPVMQFVQVYDASPPVPVVAGSPQYLDIDIGEDKPLRCLMHGLCF